MELQLPMQSVPITTSVVCFEPLSGKVYSIQYYVIRFVSDLATSWWFSQGTPVSSTNKHWPPRYNWNIVESGIKHHDPNPYYFVDVIYIQMYMYKFKHLSFLDILVFIGINIVLPTARSWRYRKCYSCNKIFIIFWGHFQVPDLSTVRSVTKHSNINIIWPSTDVYTAVRNLSSVRSVASVLVTLVPTVSIWIIATSTASQLVRSSTVLSSQIWLS